MVWITKYSVGRKSEIFCCNSIMKGWIKSKSGVQSDHTAAVQSPRENNYMKSDTAHLLSTAVVPEGQLHYKLISLYVVIFFSLRKLTTILKLLNALCQQTCPIESCVASNHGLFTFRKNVSHCKVPPYQHIAKNCLVLKWHVCAVTKMLPRINFTQINSQNLCWSREFFSEVSHLQVQLDRHDIFIHVRHTSMHFADDRDAWIGHGVAACVMNIYLKWKKKEAESRITVWHFLQENVMMQTRNDDISRENERDSCVLDGKWDRDANRRRDFVIKQISKVMDEVNHHALKGRWCNWYDNTRWWSPDAHARLKHRWGGAQAYEEDGEGKKKKKVWDGTMTCSARSHMTGGRRCYLQRGEGAGQGAGWPHAPTLLLESSSQTLKLHLLLAHGRQERRGILTLLHTHWERRQSVTHTLLHTLWERVYGTDSCVHISFQHFTTPSNTRLNQRNKWKRFHGILHSNLTCTELPYSYRVTT